MVGDVAESLHTFFVPQMEQLGLQEQPSRHGSLSTLDEEWGTGALWAHSITDHCLLTFHELRLRESMQLVEFPVDYVCITSMTDCSARLCPVDSRHLRNRNTISFQQEGGRMAFTINPGEVHHSYSLCMTPQFFDELEGVTDEEKDLLVNHLRTCDTNAHSQKIGRALQNMGPSWATRAGGALFCEAKLHEVLACALEDAVREAGGKGKGDEGEDHLLAQEAQAMIEKRFAENLTIPSLARELYVGKTWLCKVFKEQTGSGVAEYLRAQRMAQARILLETTDAKASEIAHAVGYAHPSSFTDAFQREFGTTPSQWRRNSETAN